MATCDAGNGCSTTCTNGCGCVYDQRTGKCSCKCYGTVFDDIDSASSCELADLVNVTICDMEITHVAVFFSSLTKRNLAVPAEKLFDNKKPVRVFCEYKDMPMQEVLAEIGLVEI